MRPCHALHVLCHCQGLGRGIVRHARCHHGGKLSKGYMGPLFYFLQLHGIHNYLKIKKFNSIICSGLGDPRCQAVRMRFEAEQSVPERETHHLLSKGFLCQFLFLSSPFPPRLSVKLQAPPRRAWALRLALPGAARAGRSSGSRCDGPGAPSWPARSASVRGPWGPGYKKDLEASVTQMMDKQETTWLLHSSLPHLGGGSGGHSKPEPLEEGNPELE